MHRKKDLPSIYHPMLFQNPGYPFGDTALHIAMRRCIQNNTVNRAVLDEMISAQGKEAIREMALITNDEGHLPLDLLCDVLESCVDGAIRDNFYQLSDQLLGLMREQPVKPIKQLLALKEITQDIDVSLSDRLKNNLKLGMYLVNAARKLILESSTHPQLNQYSPEKIEQIAQSVRSMRSMQRTIPFKDTIATSAHAASTTRVGNCLEFADIALDLMRKIKPGVTGEQLCYRDFFGDHVFLVIDRDLKSDLNAPSQWGENSVVCDGWSGDVYPASQLPFKLKDFVQYAMGSTTINILRSYNPRFHELERQAFFFDTESKPHQSPEFKRKVLKRKGDAIDDSEQTPAKRPRMGQ